MRFLCSVLVLAACDRPAPQVICHNGNCSSPDTTRDDTIDALQESLALGPILDGVEWDTVWVGDEARCIFAHDLTRADRVPATDAAHVIGAYLSTADRAQFTVFIELKYSVGDRPHTADELVAHAECALDAADIISAGAAAGGIDLTLGFTTESPALFTTLMTRPRWNEAYIRIGDIFAPYASEVPKLEDYAPLPEAIEFHPDFTTAVQHESYESLGLQLVQWQFVMTREAFDSIERWEPAYVLTNQARLLRDWITR